MTKIIRYQELPITAAADSDDILVELFVCTKRRALHLAV